MFANDFIWSIYIKSLSTNKMFKAAIFAALAVLFEASAIIIYVQDYLSLIPAALGAFVGTYITKFLKHKK